MKFGWRRSEVAKTNPAKPLHTSTKSTERHHPKQAHPEIHAYIVIRDRLLAEAEEVPSNSTLHRATIANDVVEIFLKPSKKPYEAQYLPEDEAVQERERCQKVMTRIADLRGKIATPSAGTTVQKSSRPSLFGVRAIGTTPA